MHENAFSRKPKIFRPHFLRLDLFFQSVEMVGNCPHSTKNSYQKANLQSGENYGCYLNILQCAPRLLANTLVSIPCLEILKSYWLIAVK